MSAAKRRFYFRANLFLGGVLVLLTGLGFLSELPPAVVRSAILIAIAVTAAAVVLVLRRGFISQGRYRDLARLRLLSPLDFERHVAEYYRRCGYRVRLTKRSGDQGIDVIAEGRDARIGVQVKHYTDAIGNKAVQEVVAGLRFYGCTRGVVVTTSRFTPAAEALARANGIELIDGRAYVVHVARQTGLSEEAVS
jgi:HJR/Mrr/RecB family endonuclease